MTSRNNPYPEYRRGSPQSTKPNSKLPRTGTGGPCCNCECNRNRNGPPDICGIMFTRYRANNPDPEDCPIVVEGQGTGRDIFPSLTNVLNIRPLNYPGNPEFMLRPTKCGGCPKKEDCFGTGGAKWRNQQRCCTSRRTGGRSPVRTGGRSPMRDAENSTPAAPCPSACPGTGLEATMLGNVGLTTCDYLPPPSNSQALLTESDAANKLNGGRPPPPTPLLTPSPSASAPPTPTSKS